MADSAGEAAGQRPAVQCCESQCSEGSKATGVEAADSGSDTSSTPRIYYRRVVRLRSMLRHSLITKTAYFTGKPPYSNPPYSTGLGSAWDKCCRAAAGPALVIVVEGVRS